MSLAASFLQSYTLFFFPIRPGILISEENNHMSRESDHLASPAAQESRGTRRDWRPSLGSAACQCQDASFKNKNCCSQKLCWSKRDCTRIWNHLDRESFAKERRSLCCWTDSRRGWDIYGKWMKFVCRIMISAYLWGCLSQPVVGSKFPFLLYQRVDEIRICKLGWGGLVIPFPMTKHQAVAPLWFAMNARTSVITTEIPLIRDEWLVLYVMWQLETENMCLCFPFRDHYMSASVCVP